MNTDTNNRIHERRHVISALAVLLVWASLLAYITLSRLPIFLELTEDMLEGRTLPDSTALLFTTIEFWKIIPLAVLGLLLSAIFIRKTNTLFRISMATLITLVIIACMAQTYLASVGVIAVMERISKQMKNESNQR